MKMFETKIEMVRQTLRELTEDLVYFVTYDRAGLCCNYSFSLDEAEDFAKRDDLLEVVSIWGLTKEGNSQTFYGDLPSVFSVK